MPPRPVTVVKAAPPHRKNEKPKPQFHTPNPFAALANLDDEDAFPPLGSAATGRSTRSGSGGTTTTASDVSDPVGNASLRGSSLPPAYRPEGGVPAANLVGGTRSVSMPLLTRLIGAITSDENQDGRRNSGYSTISELLETFPGSNSVMSVFVAGLPSISMQSGPEHDHLRQDLLAHLSAYAPPLRAKLVPDIGPRRLLNYAFVDFKNEEDCNKVIQEGNDTKFRGSLIRLEFARGDRTIVLASPGNVDLELLKQSDESGTYGAEFRREGVRWRNLTEELAGRLCRPFGNVEKIQAGIAAVGESVVHVTFAYREEARLAFAAFGNLPLKAHLSVHWLNSPNLTAASHQPRRPVHPRGPYAPASGLPRGTRFESTGDDEDKDEIADFQGGDNEIYENANENEDHARNDEPIEENDLEQHPLVSEQIINGNDQIQQDLKQPDIQSRQEVDGKPKLSKAAMKRRRRMAKKMSLQELELQTPECGSNGPLTPLSAGESCASQISVPEAANDPRPQETVPHQELTNQPQEVDEFSAIPEAPVEAEERYFMPTTKSEISIRGDQSFESHHIPVSTSEPLNQIHQPPTSADQFIAFLNSEPHSCESTDVNDFSGPNAPTHHYEIGGQERLFSSSPAPLASTPQPTGLVSAYDGAEVDDDSGGASSGPVTSIEEVQERLHDAYDPHYAGQDHEAFQAHHGTPAGHMAETMDQIHLAANQTVPLIHRRRSDVTVADVSLPLVFRTGPNVDYCQLLSNATPSPIKTQHEEAQGAAPIRPFVSPAKPFGDLTEFYSQEPPTASSGSLATLVPAESNTEQEIVEQGCSIWVGGLPDNITPAALHTMFNGCGCIKDIEVKRSMQKTSTFAFIMFADRQNVDKALELDGMVTNGFKVTVRKRAIKQLWVAARPAAQALPTAPAPLPPQPATNTLLPIPMQMQMPQPDVHLNSPGVADLDSLSPTGSGNPYARYYAQASGMSHQNGVLQAEVENGYQGYGSPRLENDQRMVFQNANTRGRGNKNRRGKVMKPRVAEHFSQRGGKDSALRNGVSGGEIDGSSQAAVMQWGPLSQRAQGYLSYPSTGHPKVPQAQQHGVLTNSNTAPQPQTGTLHDSAILSSSEAQSNNPTALHYRGGGLYYPGGFYAAGGAPMGSFIPQGTEYYQNGYGSYVYPTYIHGHGQAWVYPYQYGVQPIISTHAAPAASYSAENDAQASSSANANSTFTFPTPAGMMPSATGSHATYFNAVHPHSHLTTYPQVAARNAVNAASSSEAVTPVVTSGYPNSGASGGMRPGANNNVPADGDRVFSGTSSYITQGARRGRRGHTRGYQPSRNQAQRGGPQV
ncbi:hypothetical protein CF326_g1717 [Tilletia indica]|nr:hypothetical protein CF326_g1717 [Tilletia indica]